MLTGVVTGVLKGVLIFEESQCLYSFRTIDGSAGAFLRKNFVDSPFYMRFYSQLGNICSPVREHLLPSKGTTRSQVGKIHIYRDCTAFWFVVPLHPKKEGK